jgi:hypothetical protein
VQITPAPATASAAEIAATGASVILAVGDIAACGTDGAAQTARFVDSVLRADSVAKVDAEVLTLGDNAMPEGAASNFALCFAPSWGDGAKLIMKKIHPSPGNHEYQSVGAAPYFGYFGSKAGSPGKGYYSFDVGAWRVLSLNSEIIVNGSFAAADRKAQEDFVRSELKGSQKLCTLAYWHHPRFSSGWHGGDPVLQPLWQLLYDGGVDVIVNGHDHEYERFRPQNPAGILDTLNGIVEYVVGTGGDDLRGYEPIVPNSDARVQGYWGVLKLTLGAGEYRGVFMDVSGRTWDPSGGKCHPKVTIPPP